MGKFLVSCSFSPVSFYFFIFDEYPIVEGGEKLNKTMIQKNLKGERRREVAKKRRRRRRERERESVVVYVGEKKKGNEINKECAV